MPFSKASKRCFALCGERPKALPLETTSLLEKGLSENFPTAPPKHLAKTVGSFLGTFFSKKVQVFWVPFFQKRYKKRKIQGKQNDTKKQRR